MAKDELDEILFELKQTNADLRSSEERFRLLLESAGEGILGLDTRGCCTFVNRAALAMLGYGREEMLRQDIQTLISPRYLQGLNSSAEQPRHNGRLFAESSSQRSTAIFQRKDDETLPVEYSFYPIQVDGRIDGSVLLFWDISESQSLIQSLSYQASHDPLTGLINRSEFENRITRIMARAQQDQSEHVLCYLDLDHFKVVNDTCGHAAGDELLRSLSFMLASTLRQRDTLARLGGDEFALLLEHCGLDQAWTIAHELCERVKNFRFMWAGNDYSVSVSIGMTVLTGADSDMSAVLSAADAACYTAKKQGGNQVQVFT